LALKPPPEGPVPEEVSKEIQTAIDEYHAKNPD